MYPNFMGNMSPEQMQNNLNMMNPEMMKNASNMFAGMSDSQIQMYLSQMGMTGVNPAMFRNMCQSMSNMDDSQFQNMKNMAQANIKNMQNNNINISNNTTNNINNKYSGTIIEEVTKIKEEGNDLFRNNKFEEAIKKYYEAIEEIKTTTEKEKYKAELNNIEKSCRLNIATCKLKTKDYDGVINECSIVIDKYNCFKANFRMGLALKEKKKYEKACRFLDKAKEMGNESEKNSVEPHLIECKKLLEEIEKKEKDEKSKKKNEEKNKEENKNKINNTNKEEIKDNKKDSQKDDNKINSVQNIIEQEKLKNKINKNKKEEEKVEEKLEEDDIKAEDTKDIKKNNSSKPINSNSKTNVNNNNFNTPPSNLNQDYINQARNQLNNMSDDQMNFMLNQMKSMDNQTLKNMMATQGMNLTDQQIEMMKMSLTPETFKMMRDPNFNPPNISNTSNINTNTNNSQQGNNNIPPQMPNLANMDYQQMFEFVKKNPDLLKMVSPQLSQMMGGRNIDPEIMMKSMEKIMWLFSLPGRIKRFMLSWRGICFIIFIIAIYYGIFKKK